MKEASVSFYSLTLLFIGLFLLPLSARAQTEGMWRGVTGEGGEVSFDVIGSTVDSFSVNAYLTGGSDGYGWLWLTVDPPMPITGTTFSFSGSAFDVTGTFTSATTAVGTYDYHNPSLGYSSGTWTASYVTDPYITLFPSASNFGSHTSGTTSDAVPFTLSNIGGGGATGSVYLLGSDADQFRIATGSGTFSLAPNETMEILVYFAPTSAGWKTANLTVDGDASCNDVGSNLMGTGLDPMFLSVTPEYRTVVSGAGSTTFTVTNEGDGTMHWYAETTDGWLTITSGDSGSNTGTITVSYAANDGDARIGTISVVADGALNNPQTVQVFQDSKKLTAGDGVSEDAFGYAVSVSGDYALVGAYKNDANGNDSGAAYLFEHVDNRWIQRAKLTASDGAPMDYFGQSVCLFGDYAIVGARLNDDHGYSSGSAYVFEKPLGGWTDMTETAKLTASDAAQYDFFGNAVNIGNDYAVVGAHCDDDDGENSGSVYVFEKPVGGWADMTETAKLTASDVQSYEYLGHSVSVFEDFLIAGNRYEDKAYIFERPIGGWVDATETATLTAYDGIQYERFSSSVSIFGDYAVLGSKNAAYIFEKPLGGWTNMTETAKLTADDGGDGDAFGDSVCVFGHYLIIGAHLDNDKGSGSGSAYLFERTETGWIQREKLNARDGAFGDNFGRSVAISADYIVAGAPGDDDNGSDSGSAYTYPVGANTEVIPTADEFALVFGTIIDSPGACTGDFDVDGDVDGSDLAEFAVLLQTQ